MKTIAITILILFSGNCFSQKPHTILVTEKEKKSELTMVNGIGPFYFKSDSTYFENEPYVESIVNALKIYGTEKIELVGHCSTNELNKNENIALERVEFIKSLLIKFGIPKTQIKTKVENNEIPLELKNSESELNKRVELWVM